MQYQMPVPFLEAPPATTPAAFITAINAGTNEAIAGTNKDMLDNKAAFNHIAEYSSCGTNVTSGSSHFYYHLYLL